MERHISGPREVRKGCDKGEEWKESAPLVGESRRGRGKGCGWCWLDVEARREGGKEGGKEKTVASSVLSIERGTVKEHSGARSCDGGHEK